MSAQHARAGFLFGLVLASLGLVSGCGERWEEYVSEKGRFKVRMPGRPQPDSDLSLPGVVKKVSLLQRSGSWSVAWEDLPQEGNPSADKQLDMACDGAVSKLEGKELSRKTISLASGFPGRELVIEWPDGKGVVRDRMYLVKDRLYQVLASGPKWWVESSQSSKVLDSFELLSE